MAKVKKRGNRWQIDYADPSGKRVRQSFAGKREAEAELAKRVSLIAEKRYLDVKKEYVTTLKVLTGKYLENFTGSIKEHYCENFKGYFGECTLIANIRYVNLETYRNHLKRKPTKHGHLRKDSSINREMSCLHHLFQKAVEWELIEQSPFGRGKSLILKENNKRLRFLNESEIQEILQFAQPYLKNIIICAVNTGMRKGEILNLKWDQVRNGFIYLQKTKTKESRQIPINKDLESLFNQIRPQAPGANVFDLSGKPLEQPCAPSEYVFTYRGKLIKNVKKAFQRAVDKAGIQDFKFHDLRHTFASQLIMKGGSIKDAQELLGHKTMAMTLRYAHLSQEHKKIAVNLLNGLTTKNSEEGEGFNSRNIADGISSQNIVKENVSGGPRI
jgi:integrase